MTKKTNNINLTKGNTMITNNTTNSKSLYEICKEGLDGRTMDIKGVQFNFNYDNMSGVLYIEHKKNPEITIVATPDWNGCGTIPFEVRNDDDELVFFIDGAIDTMERTLNFYRHILNYVVMMGWLN